MDHDDVIRNGFYLLQNVRGKKNGFTLTQAANQFSYISDLIWIKPTGRFIHNQDIRLVQQDVSHANPLPISFGKLMNALLKNGSKVALLHDGFDAIFEPGLRHPAGTAEKT